MKKIYLLLVFLIIPSFGESQDYFNQRERFEYPAAIHSGLMLLDTQFMTISVIADSILPYNGGLGFTVFDFSGEVKSQQFYFDELNEKMPWYPSPIVQSDSTILINGIFENEDYETLYYLARLNLKNLDLMWEKTYPWPDNVFFFQGRGMAKLNDKIYFTNRLIYEGQQENIGLQIIDADGNLISNHIIQLSDWGRPQTVETWGDIIVVGGVRYIGVPEQLGHETRSLLVGIDSLGNKLWEWTNGVDHFGNIIADIVISDNEHLVATRANGVEIIVNSSTSFIAPNEHVIFELDQNRQLVWETSFTEATLPTGYNAFRTLHKCQDGSGYIAGGSIYREGPDQTGDVLGYLAKVSIVGDSLWTRKVQYYQEDGELDSLSRFIHRLYDIDETPTGDILIAGEANEQAPFPQQAWLMKVDKYGCLVPGCHLIDGVSNITSQPDWLISPNPASDRLNVYLGTFRPEQTSQLMLFDLLGNPVRQIRAMHPNTSYSIDIQTLPSGTYALCWKIDGVIISGESVIKL